MSILFIIKYTIYQNPIFHNQIKMNPPNYVLLNHISSINIVSFELLLIPISIFFFSNSLTNNGYCNFHKILKFQYINTIFLFFHYIIDFVI